MRPGQAARHGPPSVRGARPDVRHRRDDRSQRDQFPRQPAVRVRLGEQRRLHLSVRRQGAGVPGASLRARRQRRVPRVLRHLRRSPRQRDRRRHRRRQAALVQPTGRGEQHRVVRTTATPPRYRGRVAQQHPRRRPTGSDGLGCPKRRRQPGAHLSRHQGRHLVNIMGPQTDYSTLCNDVES